MPTSKKRKDKTHMDYESFKEQFVEDVKDRLYEQGAEVNVSVHEVNKLNESYEAITVTPEGSNIGVNMAPTLVPALKIPLATARSLAGNHRRVVFTQAG